MKDIFVSFIKNRLILPLAHNSQHYHYQKSLSIELRILIGEVFVLLFACFTRWLLFPSFLTSLPLFCWFDNKGSTRKERKRIRLTVSGFTTPLAAVKSTFLEFCIEFLPDFLGVHRRDTHQRDYKFSLGSIEYSSFYYFSFGVHKRHHLHHQPDQVHHLSNSHRHFLWTHHLPTSRLHLFHYFHLVWYIYPT